MRAVLSVLILAVFAAVLLGSATGCELPAEKLNTALLVDGTSRWLEVPRPRNGWGAIQGVAPQISTPLRNAMVLQSFMLRVGILTHLDKLFNVRFSKMKFTLQLDERNRTETNVTDYITDRITSWKEPVLAVTSDSGVETLRLITGFSTAVEKNGSATTVVPLCLNVTSGNSVDCDVSISDLKSSSTTLYSVNRTSPTVTVSPAVFEVPQIVQLALVACVNASAATDNTTVLVASRLDTEVASAVVFRYSGNHGLPVALRTLTRPADLQPTSDDDDDERPPRKEMEFVFADPQGLANSGTITYSAVGIVLPPPRIHKVSTSMLWPIIDACIIVGSITLFIFLYVSGRVSMPKSSQRSPAVSIDTPLEPQGKQGYGSV